MCRIGFATGTMRGIFTFSMLLALVPAGSPVCQAADKWRPGQNMKQSMIRLLAPTSVLLEKSDYGFTQTAYLGAFLHPGNFSYMTTVLNAGQSYGFIGAGDNDVRDLDIIIEDESGKVVAEDVKDDATPVVQFTPRKTQRYKIKLKLQDARVACFCGMVWLRKGGWSVPVRNLDVAMDNMLNHCENVASQRSARFLDVPGEWAVIGTIIEEGKTHIINDIRLGTGRRAVTSGGDTVTRDIDLALFEDGPSPKIISKDQDDDASPLVQCVATKTKRYGLIIKDAKSNGGTLIFTAILEVE
jgi:hypothetical protein